MNCGEEIDCPTVVSGGDAPEVFELIEEPLDLVSELIGLCIVRDLDFSVPLGRNNGLASGLFDHLPQRCGIVRLVGDNAPGVLPIQQIGGNGNIMGLATGQNEAQWPALGIRDGMDFAGQSSSGTPQSLIFGPPFPLAACWWARTAVLSSMRY